MPYVYLELCVYTNKILSFFYFCRYVALKGPKFAYYESKDVSRNMYSDQLVSILAQMAILRRKNVLRIACHLANWETATDFW